MTNRHTERNAETYACKRYTHGEAKWKKQAQEIGQFLYKRGRRRGVEWKKTRGRRKKLTEKDRQHGLCNFSVTVIFSQTHRHVRLSRVSTNYQSLQVQQSLITVSFYLGACTLCASNLLQFLV